MRSLTSPCTTWLVIDPRSPSPIGMVACYGKLLLAGDAAHIVPPTGAKGLNVVAIPDVARLAPALVALLHDHDTRLVDVYSRAALECVWRCTHSPGG